MRTNLDVNLAVNNLLSRDDDDGDENDEGGDSYVPEDLISLLDGGFHADHSVIIDADAIFSEDMFGYSAMRMSVHLNHILFPTKFPHSKLLEWF
ncbi:hypothetical protein LSTR_LSTR016305 [Laodelphax striatellus]|uniref:E3 ubiquitin-protein ligase UBR5 ubiquitin-associated domain-containing protein n=1 Tax=Laodelphax striatellus TaxID=195883 RepID=A0A482XLP2_LAOST|nr:hypothetical protein LSTR_LSTR016305 [Laodelphax striatellus]